MRLITVIISAIGIISHIIILVIVTTVIIIITIIVIGRGIVGVESLISVSHVMLLLLLLMLRWR